MRERIQQLEAVLNEGNESPSRSMLKQEDSNARSNEEMNQPSEAGQVLLTPTYQLSGRHVPNQAIEGRLHQSEEQMQQIEDMMQQVLAQMQRASAATGSSSRREDDHPTQCRTMDQPQEVRQMSLAPTNPIASTSPPATRTTATALRDHTNIPHEIINFSLILGTKFIHQASTTSTLPLEQIWAQHFQVSQSSQTEHSLFLHLAWFP